jgi:hypothetical protein
MVTGCTRFDCTPGTFCSFHVSSWILAFSWTRRQGSRRLFLQSGSTRMREQDPPDLLNRQRIAWHDWPLRTMNCWQ